MSTQTVNRGGTYYDVPVFNARIPAEGPKSVPIVFPFTADDTSFEVDFTISTFQTFISMVQGVYVDNSANPEPVSITASGTGQVLTWPPGFQGYLPILVSTPMRFVVSSPGEVPVTINFINVPVPSILWNPGTGGGTQDTFAGGAVTVADTATQLLAGDQAGAILTNAGTGTVYLGPTDAVTTAGFPFAAGQTLSLDDYDGPMWGITASGTQDVGVMTFP